MKIYLFGKNVDKRQNICYIYNVNVIDTNQTKGYKMKFQVINRQTNKVVGTYSTSKRARMAADKKDNVYGAYIHSVKEIPFI